MEVVINKTSLTPQIVGMGEVVSEIYIILEFSGVTFLQDKFILEIRFTFKGEQYFYSKIYTTSQIDENGRLDVGEVVVLGEYKDRSELENFKVILTYLNTAPS